MQFLFKEIHTYFTHRIFLFESIIWFILYDVFFNILIILLIITFFICTLFICIYLIAASWLIVMWLTICISTIGTTVCGISASRANVCIRYIVCNRDFWPVSLLDSLSIVRFYCQNDEFRIYCYMKLRKVVDIPI